MLVIVRKNNESVWIGEDIRITVFRGKQGQIKLGIDCPRELRVLREELFTRNEKKHTPREGTEGGVERNFNR